MLQMQKQSSTQSVPKLPKAQFGILTPPADINRYDNIPKPSFLNKQAQETLAKRNNLSNRPSISQYTPKPGEQAKFDKQKLERIAEDNAPLNRMAASQGAKNMQDAIEAAMIMEGGLAASKLVGKGAKAAAKYATEQTALKNAYKLNPYAFKPTEGMMYRGIGKEGMEDALQSGLFRAKRDVTPTSIGNFNTTRQFSKAYYSPRFDIADRYGQGFIAEVPREASGWGKRYVTKEWSQIAQRDIPVTEGKVLQKDWLKRYKEVPKPTSTQRVTRGPINYWEEPGFAKRNPNFNPEIYANSPVGNVSASRDIPEGMTPKLNWDTDINWAKWNPKIPKNEKLIEEYINIENSTKANNTWMKNPDGSEFKGTPEQFVQGQSENFKKAFPQGYDKVFRGDRTHYEAIRGKGEEFYGKPIFTTTNKKLAEGFAYKEHTTSPYYNANIETIEQKLQRMYGPDMTVEKLRIEHPEVAGRILETNDGGLYELAVPKTKNELSFNAGNRLHHSLSNPEVYDKLIKEGIIPHKRPELGIFDSDDIGKFIEKKGLDRATIKNVDEGVIGDVIIHNQRPGQYAKSLRGNNGMFDMTNPNIYKALIPTVGVAGIAGASQKKNGGPIVDPRGQWAHPGQVTRIPSANITMQGVPYPVLGVASNGKQVMMQPGQDYNFGDAEHVDEYPMMGNGGEMIRRADGSYSKRGLWDNIRANKGSGKKPTKEMLEQEKNINMKKYSNGGTNNQGFEALPEYVQAKILSNMGYGGYYNPYMAEGGEANGSMALGQIMAVSDKMNKLRQFISPEQNLDPWIASKLAVIDDSTAAISDYMMYNPEAQGEGGEKEMGERNEQEGQEEMMANGGYVVTRSNDRKGKTHKVTGPGGVVKYFGDSKLGQHPKDPERKAAFYARHKKNLDGNPFFRAFARKTWENGGSIFSDNPKKVKFDPSTYKPRPDAESSEIKSVTNSLLSAGDRGANSNDFNQYSTTINKYANMGNDTSYMYTRNTPIGTEEFFHNTNQGNPISQLRRGNQFINLSPDQVNSYKQKVLTGTGGFEDGGSTFSGNAWYQDGGDYDDTNTMNSSGAYGYGYEMGGYIPDYQMAYGGAPQNYYGNQAKNFTFDNGGRVGQEMEVTPQEAEMLRQQGYQFEIL